MRTKKCWCCEGTGKAFNAIDMSWDQCLYCHGSGKIAVKKRSKKQ